MLLLLARCPNWLFCVYGTPSWSTKAATPFPLELKSCLLSIYEGLCSSDKLSELLKDSLSIRFSNLFPLDCFMSLTAAVCASTLPPLGILDLFCTDLCLARAFIWET